jgi:hypothetical protein
MMIPGRIVAGAVAVMSLAACGDSEGGYDYVCPETAPVQLLVLDLSSSGRNEAILAERLDAVQVDAEFVADCDGELLVLGWSGSSTASKLLYAGRIEVVGATEIGKDRQIPEAVDQVMTEIRRNVQAALNELPSSNNDFLGGLFLVADVIQGRRGETGPVTVHMYTDAISTGGDAPINSPDLTPEAVARVVAAQTVPGLGGVEMRIYGVGRVGGETQPPQDYIGVVQDYALGLCRKTGAACSVFTTVVSY